MVLDFIMLDSLVLRFVVLDSAMLTAVSFRFVVLDSAMLVMMILGRPGSVFVMSPDPIMATIRMSRRSMFAAAGGGVLASVLFSAVFPVLVFMCVVQLAVLIGVCTVEMGNLQR